MPVQPDFSVVIPIYNRAHLIAECLNSVLAQEEVEFEIVLVDNNSKDDLAGALRPFTDSRIRLTECSKPGASAARNAGVQMARGRFISFIDSDDAWRPDVLKTVLPFMEKGAAAAYLRFMAFDGAKPPAWDTVMQDCRQVRKLADLGESVSLGVWGTNTLCAVRRDIIGGSHKFDEDMPVVEDVDWALRHVAFGPVIYLDDVPRLAYRAHEGNVGKDRKAYLYGTLRIVETVEKGGYPLKGRRHVQRRLVRLLVGSVVNIARFSGWREGFRVYLRVVKIAVRWFQLDLLFFPEHLPVVIGAWVRRRFSRSTT